MIRHRLQLALLLAAPLALSAQPPCGTTHLTIFDANLAEFLEERTFDLQAGPNSIEWRSLMPQTYVRTIRVTAGDGVAVTRQDVTYDGPDVCCTSSNGMPEPLVHAKCKSTISPLD